MRDPEHRPAPSERLPAHELSRLVAVVSRLPHRRGSVSHLSPEQKTKLEELAARRVDGEPLQYLEGTVQFGPLELVVDRRVLIPRPETEYLFEILRTHPSPSVVVDLCTGSGALALVLKNSFPSSRVIGTDLSVDALAVASHNATVLGLEVEWLPGDLFEALPGGLQGHLDLLVANPPYIAEGEWYDLPEDVRREPRMALISGPTGSEAAEQILLGVAGWLSPTGEAWVEVGETQARHLADRFKGELVVDQFGRDRFVRIRGALSSPSRPQL